MSDANSELIPLWEVFIRPRTGLAHSHVGSVHAADEVMALQAARDVYTRRGEGVSIWVVPSASITASAPKLSKKSPTRTRSTLSGCLAFSAITNASSSAHLVAP